MSWNRFFQQVLDEQDVPWQPLNRLRHQVEERDPAQEKQFLMSS
jgi:hypothetical protein